MHIFSSTPDALLSNLLWLLEATTTSHMTPTSVDQNHSLSGEGIFSHPCRILKQTLSPGSFIESGFYPQEVHFPLHLQHWELAICRVWRNYLIKVTGSAL